MMTKLLKSMQISSSSVPNKDRHDDSSHSTPRSQTMATQILNSMYRLLPQEKQTREVLEKGLEAGADLLDTILVSGANTSRAPHHDIRGLSERVYKELTCKS